MPCYWSNDVLHNFDFECVYLNECDCFGEECENCECFLNCSDCEHFKECPYPEKMWG